MRSYSLVVGYHGCDRSLVERVVLGKDELKPSQNNWDWLGHGVYFWEDSCARGAALPSPPSAERGSEIKTPAILGAVIQLGHCLNLTETEALALVKEGYDGYLQLCKDTGSSPLDNRGAALQVRFLDCAVIETLHRIREREGKQPFDTVRGFFVEGRELYPGAGFRELDHIQICVRSPKQIIGYFLPRDL